MKLAPKTALFALLMPLTLSLCAATPPEEGSEFRGSAGYDYFEYESGGCGTPSYVNRAHEGRGSVSVSYRHESGITGIAAGSFGVAKVTDASLDSPPEEVEPGDDLSGDETGRTIISGIAVARAGYHHDFFGVELGLGAARNQTPSFDDVVFLTPSARAWAGYPKYAYVFADAISALGSAGYFPLELGLGHASDSLRVEAGIAGPNGAAMLHGQLPLEPDVWLGAKLHFGAFTSARTETLHSAGGLVTLSTSF